MGKKAYQEGDISYTREKIKQVLEQSGFKVEANDDLYHEGIKIGYIELNNCQPSYEVILLDNFQMLFEREYNGPSLVVWEE